MKSFVKRPYNDQNADEPDDDRAPTPNTNSLPKNRIENNAAKIGDENMIAAVIVGERYLTAKIKMWTQPKAPRAVSAKPMLCD